MRTALMLLILTGITLAADKKQVEWVVSLEKAFQQARDKGRPVMVCINAKEGESANERAARQIYKDSSFVKLSREFVMVVISVKDHGSGNPCARFGHVTCGDHTHAYIELKQRYRKQFVIPGTDGEMISPQHAWFEPNGTLLLRREYELTKGELMKRMLLVLKEAGRTAAATTPADKRRLLLERARSVHEGLRRAALDNLLAHREAGVVAELLKRTPNARPDVLCDLLRAFGRARVLEARVPAEGALTHEEPRVRSFAAVALERLAQEASLPLLLKRAKAERDATARKNVYRALGACGGVAGDKKAAQRLSKGMKDRDRVVAKHAVLAMAHYRDGAATALRKRLEKAAANKKTTAFMMRAVAYSLGHVGNDSTSVKALRKALDRVRDRGLRKQIRTSMDVLTGRIDGHGELPDAIFWEDRDDDARDA